MRRVLVLAAALTAIGAIPSSGARGDEYGDGFFSDRRGDHRNDKKIATTATKNNNNNNNNTQTEPVWSRVVIEWLLRPATKTFAIRTELHRTFVKLMRDDHARHRLVYDFVRSGPDLARLVVRFAGCPNGNRGSRPVSCCLHTIDAQSPLL